MQYAYCEYLRWDSALIFSEKAIELAEGNENSNTMMNIYYYQGLGFL